MISHIELSIYNVLGQKVSALVNKKQAAVNYKVNWDASEFASGIYFYRLETDKGFMLSYIYLSRKMILLK